MANSARDGRLNDLLAGIAPKHRKAWQKYLAALPAELVVIERDLASLPDESWAALRRNILRQIDQRRPAHNWPQARDLLHEARAFRYLAEQGCTEIAFSSPTMLARSPDLTARLGAQTVLCEVKTLRLTGNAIARKLRTRLMDAEEQLTAHGDDTALRLIYLVLDQGDAPSVTADRIRAEITEIARASIPVALRIVIDAGEAVGFGSGDLLTPKGC